MTVCPNDTSCHAVQRYVMAILYFSLKGYQWTECSAPKDWECADEASLAESNCNLLPYLHYPDQPRAGCLHTMPWLSSHHECMWGGLACHSEDHPELAWCMDQIEFQNNNVKGIIPDEIASLKHLRFLALEQGETGGTIPSVLGLLHNIEMIDLDHNKVTSSVLLFQMHGP